MMSSFPMNSEPYSFIASPSNEVEGNYCFENSTWESYKNIPDDPDEATGDSHQDAGCDDHADRLSDVGSVEDTSERDAAVKNYNNIIILDIRDLMVRDLKPREEILTPWLQSQTLAMVHAPRGIGKSYLALQIALTVTCGAGFINWNAAQAHSVIYIDGEMSAYDLQMRIAGIAAGIGKEPRAPLQIFTPDVQMRRVPDLSTREGQEAIEPYVQDNELIIIDNISTLFRSINENIAHQWDLIQQWALNLKSKGKSILFIHHSGKSGKQRGTSKREDVLDVVIGLKRPKDYAPEDECRFELHFEKARGLSGADVMPIDLKMHKDNAGVITWTLTPIGNVVHERVLELTNLGMNQSDIARELGVHKSTVCRFLREAQVRGEI